MIDGPQKTGKPAKSYRYLCRKPHQDATQDARACQEKLGERLGITFQAGSRNTRKARTASVRAGCRPCVGCPGVPVAYFFPGS